MSEKVIRIAVMSDVHSNMAALDACLSDSKRFKAKYYLFLGDLVFDWHQPNEVLKKVSSISDRVIRGNRENLLINRRKLEYDGMWSKFDQFASLEWTYKAMSSKERDYIESLPAQMRVPVNDHYSLRMVHGSVFSPDELLLIKDGGEAVRPSLEAVKDNVLLFGHTHEQWQTVVNGKIAINPGSVGIHYNKKRAAEYVIIEISGDQINVIFRQVNYDLEKYAASFYKTDLYEKAHVWFFVNYIGMQKGKCIMNEFLKDVEEERKISDLSTSGPVPNDIWYKVFEEKYSKIAMNYFFKQ